MRKPLFYLLTIALVMWLQMAGNYFLGTAGLSVNIVLVVTLYMGLARGPLAGETMGFFWGLLVDASTLGLMGLHSLIYAAAGFMAGMLRRQLDEDKVWTQTILSMSVSVLYLMFYFLLDRMFSQGPHPVSWGILAQPLTNGLIAPVVFWLIHRWSQLWNLMPQEE